MSYAKIHNLYDPRGQEILKDAECYALEKVQGTSAHLTWKNGRITYSSGGADASEFRALFDDAALTEAFRGLSGDAGATVYGEAYGGTQQGQAWRYGPSLRFVAFEVQAKGGFRPVPVAQGIVVALGLEFVPWKRVTTDLASLDAERDAPSLVARCRGMGVQPREGVVLRPLAERFVNNERAIAKHKRKEERETATYREVNAADAVVYENARAVADEWVTAERMRHVAARVSVNLGRALNVRDTPTVIAAMVEDVLIEGASEVPDTAEVRKELARAVPRRFNEWMKETR